MQERNKNSNIVAWLLLNIAYGYMFLVFTPLESYLANKSDFWFKLSTLLGVTLISFILCVVIATLLFGYVIGRIEKIASKLYALLLSIFVYAYIQGNYVPRDYGILNGDSIDFSAYPEYGIASIILLAMAVVLFVVLIIKFSDKVFTIGKYVSLFVLAILLVTTVTLFIGNASELSESDDEYIVTDYGMYDYSADNNVLILVFDTLDASFVQEALVSDYGDELRKTLEDFTFYPDTVGNCPMTNGGMTGIITGKTYKNEMPYREWVKLAYEDNPIYDAMDSNGYEFGVYTSERQTLDQGNDRYINLVKGEYKLSDALGFASTLYKMTAFNYMPHQLKRFFVIYTGDFDRYKMMKGQDDAYIDNMCDLYKSLCEDGITVSRTGNCVRLLHNFGTHPPYYFDENLVEDTNGTFTKADVTHGCMVYLDEYLRQLKELGIYDKSTIMVMADHGYENYRQNPTFMIKNRGEHHEFVVSDVKMSYNYLPDIFIRAYEGVDSDEAYIKSVAEANEYRTFLQYHMHDVTEKEYFPDIFEMATAAHAWELQGDYWLTARYKSGDYASRYAYRLGKPTSFANMDGVNDYALMGIYESEGDCAWTTTNEAILIFALGSDKENYELTLDYYSAHDSDHVQIFANNQPVADYWTNGEERVSFDLPGEYVDESGVVELRLDFPDSAFGDDGRMLTLGIKSITIDKKK